MVPTTALSHINKHKHYKSNSDNLFPETRDDSRRLSRGVNNGQPNSARGHHDTCGFTRSNILFSHKQRWSSPLVYSMFPLLPDYCYLITATCINVSRTLMFQVYRNKCLLHHFTSLSLHPSEYHQQSARSRQPYKQLRVQPAKLSRLSI